MGRGAASNQTDQRPGVWGLQIMSCVHVSYKQWAKTVPEKEEKHISSDFCITEVLYYRNSVLQSKC